MEDSDLENLDLLLAIVDHYDQITVGPARRALEHEYKEPLLWARKRLQDKVFIDSAERFRSAASSPESDMVLNAMGGAEAATYVEVTAESLSEHLKRSNEETLKYLTQAANPCTMLMKAELLFHGLKHIACKMGIGNVQWPESAQAVQEKLKQFSSPPASSVTRQPPAPQ